MEYDGIKWDKISWLFLEFTEMGSTYIDLGHARLRLKTTWYVHTHEVSFVEMWYRNDRTLTFMFFFNIIASYLNILFSLRKLLVSYRSITPKTKPLCRESCPPQRAFLGDVSATDKKWEEAQPWPRLQASLESRCASGQYTEIPKIASKSRWTISPMDPMGLGLGFKSMLLLALLGTALEYIWINLEIWVACNQKRSFSVSTFLQTDCLGADLLLYQGRWKQRRPCVCSKECTLQSKFAYCNP